MLEPSHRDRTGLSVSQGLSKVGASSSLSRRRHLNSKTFISVCCMAFDYSSAETVLTQSWAAKIILGNGLWWHLLTSGAFADFTGGTLISRVGVGVRFGLVRLSHRCNRTSLCTEQSSTPPHTSKLFSSMERSHTWPSVWLRNCGLVLEDDKEVSTLKSDNSEGVRVL